MELTTARLSLAPSDPDRDAEALHAAYGDPQVMRWWNTPIRAEIADTRRDLVNSLSGEGAHFWVVRETEQPVGLVGLLGDVAVPVLSWMLCRQAWGRGLMTEAADAVTNYAFGSLSFCPGRSLGGVDKRPLPFDGAQTRPHRTRSARATVSAPRRTTRIDRSR